MRNITACTVSAKKTSPLADITQNGHGEVFGIAVLVARWWASVRVGGEKFVG